VDYLLSVNGEGVRGRGQTTKSWGLFSLSQINKLNSPFLKGEGERLALLALSIIEGSEVERGEGF
jgi:hypothetical protein